MNKRDRIYAALEGLPVDQVPLSMWRYFHKQEQTPTGLASATLAFYKRYNFDLIKLTPGTLYAIEDWGAKIVFSDDDEQPSQLKKAVISKPADWRNLATLRGTDGTYGQMLESIKLVKNQLSDEDAPVLMTVFTPLTIAYQLAGDVLFDHLENHSTDVHIGLATIAETISRFANVALDAGADGIFFNSQMATTTLLSEENIQTYAVAYDLIALERVKSQPVPLILHLEGDNVHFDVVNQYPVHAISWRNNGANVSVDEALTLTEKTLMTGLQPTVLEEGQPNLIIEEMQKAIQTTGGHRLILASCPGIPPKTPDENLQAVSKVETRHLS